MLFSFGLYYHRLSDASAAVAIALMLMAATSSMICLRAMTSSASCSRSARLRSCFSSCSRRRRGTIGARDEQPGAALSGTCRRHRRKATDGGSRLPPEAADAQRALSDGLQTRVRGAMGKRKGKIVVDFVSVEELQRLLGLMLAGRSHFTR